MSTHPCADCGHDTLSRGDWRRMTPAEHLASPARERRGRGLCSTCHTRHYKAGTLDDFGRLSLSREEILEELEMLVAGRGITDFALLGKALDMDASSVSRALIRAARAGNPDAIRIRKFLPIRKAS